MTSSTSHLYCVNWMTRNLPARRNTYTVLNALAGHFNSFGNNAPLPKKRLDRIVKVRMQKCTFVLAKLFAAPITPAPCSRGACQLNKM